MENAHKWKTSRLEIGAVLLTGAGFFALACAIARTRLLWYDEIFTRQIVDLKSWSRIMTALRHGIDLQPPLFYFLTAPTRYIGGEEIGLRLPAMLGFTFAGLALYTIARRWFSPGYAFGVAVTPWILFFDSLTMESRPYGMVIGCAALALLGWTFRDRRPLPGRIAYLAGILGASSVHYYGFVIAAPFGIAAVWTLVRKRRLDLWTLLGCVCAILPNLWNLSLIRSGIGMYKAGWWSKPGWRVLLNSSYGQSLGVLAALSILFIVMTFGKRTASPEPAPDGEDLACWGGFAAIPILAMVVAKAYSGMFVLRYFSIFSLGFGLLMAYLLEGAIRERSVKASHLAGYLAAGGALLAFGWTAAATEHRFVEEGDIVSSACDHFIGVFDRPEYRQSRLLIGDPHFALQFGAYCEDVRNRIVFGADPAHQLTYLGDNTNNQAMLLMRESPPIDIEPLDDFLRAGRHPLLVLDGQSSYLKPYLSDTPEYAQRLHTIEQGRDFTLYELDPAISLSPEGK